MSRLSFKTISANKETAQKEWLLVDAKDQTLGRLASTVAKLIRGKNKVNFTPHVDCGDQVVVINAEHIKVSGNKLENKQYIRHTGYPGGQRITSLKDMMNAHPNRVIEKAVRGMLPKNKLGRAIFKNLYVYSGPEHDHQAQKPRKVNLNEIK